MLYPIYNPYFIMNSQSTHLHSTAKCWHCKATMDTRVRRNMFVKLFLFWIPLKAYFCHNCLTKRYVVSSKTHYEEISTI